MFWKMTKSELVGGRQSHSIHFRHWGHHNAYFLFPIQNFLWIVFNYLLSAEHYQLLCANFRFFLLCLPSNFIKFPHSSFKHNTFYIWDVLRSYFLIVFSKKRSKKSKNRTLIFSSWPGYSDCVVYCTFWETILYILAFDSLNYLTLWRTWQIPLEHNEYVKKIYIK